MVHIKLLGVGVGVGVGALITPRSFQDKHPEHYSCLDPADS